MLLRYNPDKSENISSSSNKITYTNLFSTNSLVYQILEGGHSLTLGFDYELKIMKENLINFGIGQIYRDTNEERFPKKSTMQNKSSDVVGFPNLIHLKICKLIMNSLLIII